MFEEGVKHVAAEPEVLPLFTNPQLNDYAAGHPLIVVEDTDYRNGSVTILSPCGPFMAVHRITYTTLKSIVNAVDRVRRHVPDLRGYEGVTWLPSACLKLGQGDETILEHGPEVFTDQTDFEQLLADADDVVGEVRLFVQPNRERIRGELYDCARAGFRLEYHHVSGNPAMMLATPMFQNRYLIWLCHAWEGRHDFLYFPKPGEGSNIFSTHEIKLKS